MEYKGFELNDDGLLIHDDLFKDPRMGNFVVIRIGDKFYRFSESGQCDTGEQLIDSLTELPAAYKKPIGELSNIKRHPGALANLYRTVPRNIKLNLGRAATKEELSAFVSAHDVIAVSEPFDYACSPALGTQSPRINAVIVKLDAKSHENPVHLEAELERKGIFARNNVPDEIIVRV